MTGQQILIKELKKHDCPSDILRATDASKYEDPKCKGRGKCSQAQCDACWERFLGSEWDGVE